MCGVVWSVECANTRENQLEVIAKHTGAVNLILINHQLNIYCPQLTQNYLLKISPAPTYHSLK